MMPKRIWNFWAKHYKGLWAQYFALKPTRDMVIDHMASVAPDKGHILDAGCGVGQLAHELSVQLPFSRILAIDSSSSMIEEAGRLRPNSNISYRCARIQDVSEDGPFDVIVSTHAFPYFPQKIEALRCMYSMLKPGGRLIMVHATMENVYDALFLVFVRITVSHAQYHSVHRLASMMQGVGFVRGKVESMKRLWFIPSIYMIEGLREKTVAS